MDASGWAADPKAARGVPAGVQPRAHCDGRPRRDGPTSCPRGTAGMARASGSARRPRTARSPTFCGRAAPAIEVDGDIRRKRGIFAPAWPGSSTAPRASASTSGSRPSRSPATSPGKPPNETAKRYAQTGRAGRDPDRPRSADQLGPLATRAAPSRRGADVPRRAVVPRGRTRGVAAFEALADLDDAQLDRPVERAHGWSGRDLLGHLLSWQLLALEVARELAVRERSKAKELADADWATRGDIINDEAVLAWRARPMSEVRARPRADRRRAPRHAHGGPRDPLDQEPGHAQVLPDRDDRPLPGPRQRPRRDPVGSPRGFAMTAAGE